MKIDEKDYNNLVISLTSKLARICGKAIEIPLEKVGVTLQEFKIVGLLIGEKGVMQKTLAKKLMVRPSTLSVAIDKLESKGTIQRKISPEDKRINYLSLCNGIDLSEMNTLLFDTESQMLKGISPEEVEVTVKTLQLMIKNLEEELNDS